MRMHAGIHLLIPARCAMLREVLLSDNAPTCITINTARSVLCEHSTIYRAAGLAMVYLSRVCYRNPLMVPSLRTCIWTVAAPYEFLR